MEVHIPPSLCEAKDCPGVKAADAVFHLAAEGRLELVQVCAQHVFLMKGYWPVIFFPLNQTPALEFIAQCVQREHARRNPPRPMYYGGVHFNGGTNLWTQTSSGGWF